MGEIGPDVHKILTAHGLDCILAGFPQNLFNDEPGYRRSLCLAILRHKPRLVLPIGHPLAMARFKELFENGVDLRAIVNSRRLTPEAQEAVAAAIFVVEREEVIRTLDSKVALSRLARSLKVPTPRVYDDIADINFSNQVVFKRDISFGGHGVHLPKTRSALDNLIAHQSPGEPFLIEDFVYGCDYSLDTVRSASGIAASGYLCHKPAGNGPATQRTVLPEKDAVLEQMKCSACRILEHLDYHGVCGFDFRVSPQGEALLLEANPRFTGGVAAQASSGFDIPYLLITSLS